MAEAAIQGTAAASTSHVVAATGANSAMPTTSATVVAARTSSARARRTFHPAWGAAALEKLGRVPRAVSAGSVTSASRWSAREDGHAELLLQTEVVPVVPDLRDNA